jgi:hypothetical protein
VPRICRKNPSLVAWIGTRDVHNYLIYMTERGGDSTVLPGTKQDAPEATRRARPRDGPSKPPVNVGIGGEGGIRTPGPSRVNGFQDR